MKKIIFAVLFIAMCVTLIAADSGEEMLKHAISDNQPPQHQPLPRRKNRQLLL